MNDLRPKDRDIAMVFQNYALYPYLTVYENVAFGLRARKTPRAEIERRVKRATDMLGLGALLERYPRQLSGGQRQRVAIGRAIVRDARLFLFDEPLSNLDAQLRDEMRSELKRLHRELGKTFMYVTHDQIEAMTLADRIVVLKDGRVEQQGSPLDLFERPQTRFVAGFIGSPQMNFIALRDRRRRGRAAGRVCRTGACSPLPRDAGAGCARVRTAAGALLGIRPTRLAVAGAGPPRPGHRPRSRDRRPDPADRRAQLHLLQARRRRAYWQRSSAHDVTRPGAAMAVDLDLNRAVADRSRDRTECYEQFVEGGSAHDQRHHRAPSASSAPRRPCRAAGRCCGPAR